eukprot:UN21715
MLFKEKILLNTKSSSRATLLWQLIVCCSPWLKIVQNSHIKTIFRWMVVNMPKMISCCERTIATKSTDANEIFPELTF